MQLHPKSIRIQDIQDIPRVQARNEILYVIVASQAHSQENKLII